MALFYAVLFILLSLLNGYLFLETGILVSLISQGVCIIVAINFIYKWKNSLT